MSRRPRTRPVPAALAAAGLAVALAACAEEAPAPAPTASVPPATTGAAPAATGAPPTTASPEEPEASAASAASPASPTPTAAGVPTGEVEVVADGLPLPWSAVALPDGSALVSLRDEARLVRVTPDGDVVDVTTTAEDGTVGGAAPAGEGGLLGLALSPAFAEDRLLYAYVTRADDNAVVRAVLDGDALGEPEVVLDGIPRAQVHNGGRIAFGPDGTLHVATGDAREPGLSRDPSSPAGKVLRLTPDGDPAPGNPTPGSPVWSQGHRNVQGLGWDAQGRLWASELGQDTWDELNLVEGGADHGWPDVEGPGDDGDRADGLVDPVAWWPPSEASPSGLAVIDDAVWVSALRGERLWRVPVPTGADGGAVGQPEPYLVGEHGRLRDVAVAPGGGALWVLTNEGDGDDALLRVPLG